jgi:hypothetical protein
MCEYQGFYITFSVGCSFYVNLLIAHELFRLLSATRRLESYKPPSRQSVLLRCLGVALPCAILASLGALGILPHEARLMRGVVCLTSASGTIGRRSPIFLPVIFPILVFIPTALTVAFAVVSWRRKLLNFELKRLSNTSCSDDFHARAAHRQRVQQARMLTIYFARILVVVLLWYPAIACMFTVTHSPAPAAIGAPFAFVQSIVSAAMSLTKTDVRDAVICLFRRLTCQPAAPVAPLSCTEPDLDKAVPGRTLP